MKEYLFIHSNKVESEFGIVRDGNLISYYKRNNEDINIGNIYRAKVIKRIDSLNCFFVQLADSKEGFLDFKDTIGEIKVGDTVFVEVYKLNSGKKAPNVSMNISVSSVISVVNYKSDELKLSKKIKSHSLDLDLIKDINSNYGIKIRTKAKFIDNKIVMEDIKANIEKMNCMISTLNHLPIPQLVYKNENYLLDFLYDNSDIDCIINNRDLYRDFKKNSLISNKLILDEEYNPLYDYNIGQYIQTFEKKEIFVDDINIVIEKCEALTVIDVNSNFSNKGLNKNENAYLVNRKAFSEIIRQISFRDISGIIIIDFINMSKVQREKLSLEIDKTEIIDNKIWNFHGFTKLGLYEITRQRGK